MALSVDSQLKSILANPKAVEVLETLAPGATNDPKLKLMSSFTLRKIMLLSGKGDPEKIEEVNALLAGVED